MRVTIGLGSNIGTRRENIAAALRHLEALPDTVVLGVSHAYESEAWPSPDDPPYANAVAVIDTRIGSLELLPHLKEIERAMGRDPFAERNAPRVIDLDILLAGDDEWERPDLVVPHPRLAERDFVVTPLLELDPGARYPDGSPVTRAGVRVGRIIGVLGPVPGFADRTPGADVSELPAVPPMPGRERTPLPGEEWVDLLRHPREGGPVGGPPTFVSAGWAPDASVSFVQVILEQEGIPFAWDPFPPEEGADPYGFPRPFRLLVPASMAADAARTLDEAMSAPFDLSEAYELAEESGPAAGDEADDRA